MELSNHFLNLFQVERDRWQNTEEILYSIEMDTCRIGCLEFAINIRDTLVPEG